MSIDLIRRLARFGAPIAVLTICVLSLVPGNERPHTGAPGQFEHFLAYALTAGGLSVAYPTRRGRILAGLALLASMMEICQLWIPGRTAQVIDAVASSAGALTGIVLYGLLPGWLRDGHHSR